MAQAPIIYFEFAEHWSGPDATEGATLFVLVPTTDEKDVRPQVVGHLRSASERSRIALREALRKRRPQQ